MLKHTSRIAPSEVLKRSNVVGHRSRVKSIELIDVLTELQRGAGESSENAAEFPPSNDVVNDVVAARPFLAGSKWQIIDIRQPKVMRMVEAEGAVIEREAHFREGRRGWTIKLQPVLPRVVVLVAHRSRIGLRGLNEKPMTRAMVYGD